MQPQPTLNLGDCENSTYVRVCEHPDSLAMERIWYLYTVTSTD